MDTEGRQEPPAAAGEGTLTAKAEKLAREHARDVAEEPPLTDQEVTVLRDIQTEATDLEAQFEVEEALGRPLSADERHQIVQAQHAVEQKGRQDGGGARNARPHCRTPGRATTRRPAAPRRR